MAEAFAAGVGVVALKESVKLIRTPATKLKQTKANANQAHRLVSENVDGMPEDACQQVFSGFHS